MSTLKKADFADCKTAMDAIDIMVDSWGPSEFVTPSGDYIPFAMPVEENSRRKGEKD